MDRRRLWWIAVGVAALLAAASFTDGKGFRRYFVLRQSMTLLAEKNRQLASQNQKLAREIDALRKDVRVQERAVREELGFVKPNEVVVTLE